MSLPRVSCLYCGKMSYSSKADAKRAIRTFHKGEHMSPYRCGDHSWHIGHLPKVVLDGRVPRQQLHTRKRPADAFNLTQRGA